MDNVTGRDDWIIQQALMWAIAAIDRCSPDWRPYADRADMETLLLAWYGHDRDALDRDVRQFTQATAWPLILRHDDASDPMRTLPQRSHSMRMNQDGKALNGWSSASAPVGSSSAPVYHSCMSISASGSPATSHASRPPRYPLHRRSTGAY